MAIEELKHRCVYTVDTVLVVDNFAGKFGRYRVTTLSLGYMHDAQ